MPSPSSSPTCASSSSSSTLTPAREGYDKLANLMTSDKGLSIFRSFKRLNAKNLLYYQAEIEIKEKELNDIIQADRDSQDFMREKLTSSVRLLQGIGEPSEQWVKWLEIRALLEKYNEAFAQHAQLLRYKPPHKRDLKVFKQWLQHNSPCMMPAECNQWFGPGDENAADLITLCGRYENVDSVTRWVFRVGIPFWHKHVSWYWNKLFRPRKARVQDIETGTMYYDDEKIVRTTRVVSTITSSAIPASSMLALYLIDNMITRLIIIIVYNIGFSIIIGLLAKARRVEVFAASTAFAAVQVAFITNFPRD
ncbi:uncharacterized protein BDV17DRAFT_288166 [Aspergillus undulatus]|uniref:uncharacterized protein n=1 Tax=Aspergillus undulatus TaxID=1810928 RepID=UPI003CCE1E4C